MMEIKEIRKRYGAIKDLREICVVEYGDMVDSLLEHVERLRDALESLSVCNCDQRYDQVPHSELCNIYIAQQALKETE